MPNCWQRNAYKVAAGIVWSFKDGLKYGYMAYKAVKLGDIKADWPYYATLVGSLLLYWIFLLTGNGFEGPKCTPLTTSMGPKVALYLYWTLVDIVASLVVLNKMRKAIKMSKDAKIENKEFNSIKFKEEIRLLIASVGMTIVTILSIINAFNPSFNVLSIWRIVFVYIQLLMVLSQKGASGGGSETTSQSQSMKSSKGTKA
ncbi:hypothetical protein BDR26DRAFT_855336 [Obelidium mucronatum]|nr:hypothetical protein BDR26DRAFT_855336 [Obelidium mucronatum]